MYVNSTLLSQEKLSSGSFCFDYFVPWWRKEANSPLRAVQGGNTRDWSGDEKSRKLQKIRSLDPNNGGEKPSLRPDTCVHGSTSWAIISVWTWGAVCGSRRDISGVSTVATEAGPWGLPLEAGGSWRKTGRVGVGPLSPWNCLTAWSNQLHLKLSETSRGHSLMSLSSGTIRRDRHATGNTSFLLGLRLMGPLIDLDLFSNGCFHVSFG